MFDAGNHDSNHDQEEVDMDLNSIESANLDALMAEEAILDWLVNLETDDTDYEITEEEPQARRAVMAN